MNRLVLRASAAVIFTVVIVLCVMQLHAAPDASATTQPAAAGTLHFTARGRKEIAPGSGKFEVTETPGQWDARHTAVIICDLWDQHWCKGATQRVGEMAPRVNELVKAVRAQGGLIVHAPSDTMKNYEGTPQRALAKNAPPAKDSKPFKWNYLDPTCEANLPIDDKDGGCDDDPPSKTAIVWKGEHPAVQILDGDAISDNGQEIYNLFEQRGITNILYVGVHTNMCVLGRSFGIRQMSRLGKHCMLVRDLTDSMYNPHKAPFVSHRRGAELMVEHVEKYWCPTILSSDIIGDPKPSSVVIVAAEQEYDAKHTLAAFARDELEAHLGCKCTVLVSDSTTDIPGLEALDHADLLIMFMRRRTLPDEQLKHFRDYFDSGRPVVALRTSSHAFQNWLDFDQQVLGCHYQNHYGNKGTLHVSLAEKASAEPILRGVSGYDSDASLYRIAPLAPTATALLMGTWEDKPAEPVAITNTYKGGRIFYTSLGHPDDFKQAAFQKLLTNGIRWALDRAVPAP